MKTRRQFLATAATALAGATVAPALLASKVPTVGTVSSLDYATFARLLATEFEVQELPTANLALKLDKVEQHPTESGECFTLTLRSTADHVLPQNTYSFKHEQLGALEMFIVPGRQDAAGPLYHATFNRCA